MIIAPPPPAKPRRRRLSAWPDSYVPLARTLALKDLFFFATEVLGFGLLEEEPHGALCRWLMRPSETGKRMVFMPRITFKSTVVTISYPLWRIAQDQDERILIDSDLRSNAKKYAGLCKRHIEGNPRFRQLFGDLVGRSGWTEDFFTVAREMDFKEPTMMTAGTDQVTVGLHFKRILGDDIVNNTNVGSADQMEKVLDHIRLFGPLLELDEIDPATEQIITGTFWDDADPHRTLLRESGMSDEEINEQLSGGEARIGDWEVFFRAAYQDEDGRQMIGSEGPRTLFSAFTPKALEKQRTTLGTYLFAANFLMDPVPAGEATFKRAWFRPARGEMKADLAVVMTIDPARSQAKRSSKSAILVLASDPGKKIRVLSTWKKRVGERELIQKIFEVYLVYRPHLVGMETAVFQTVLKLLLDDEGARRNMWVPVLEMKPPTHTLWEVRIRGLLQPLYESGMIEHMPGMGELELELRRFPKGKEDDLIDCMAYAVEMLGPPRQTKEKGTPPEPENKTTGY